MDVGNGRILAWIVVIAAAAAWVLYRRCQYPGNWSHAFSTDFTTDRQTLATARREVHALRTSAALTRTQATSQAYLAQQRYTRRIDAAEERLRTLRLPRQRGRIVEELGDLTLYEEALVMDAEQIPISGLKARFEGSFAAHYVYITMSDGQERRFKVSRTEYDEDRVRDFASQITNTSTTHKSSLVRRAQDIEEAEAELKAARADTEDRDKARQLKAEVAERQKKDKRLDAARAELQQAHEVWHELTGRKPIW
ncbi:hypothetical protein [Streptomyces albipurpureus]|uniref:Secreted protein n=1 Tax=Streptomyces albipurpureus TaxID=2897419 RepID=A0ABT0UYX5_9ACTN|nr:hypothetical protein [Streptomyces sp. CWNU-1]MCM2393762.1 hypothetical protein [Streptomyces sp. CWNU-1]